MEGAPTYPITPRLPYRVFCQATANQTPPTDHTLSKTIPTVGLATAALPGKLELPPFPNNLELRFLAYDSGSTDPDNDDSLYRIFGYPAEGNPGASLFGQLLCAISVNYSSKIYTVNPFSGVTTGDWAENDDLTFSVNHIGATVSGPTVNDVSQSLKFDVQGLKYVYVVNDDLSVTGTNVEQTMCLGRSF